MNSYGFRSTEIQRLDADKAGRDTTIHAGQKRMKGNGRQGTELNVDTNSVKKDLSCADLNRKMYPRKINPSAFCSIFFLFTELVLTYSSVPYLSFYFILFEPAYVVFL
jgi:hypothetical protein